MDFRKFKRIMSYCKQYGGATLDGFGRVVKFDSGYQVAYTDHLSIWDWKNSKCIYVEAQNE